MATADAHTTLPATAIGYIRVSTDAQAGEKQTSLADQRAALDKLAARLGVTVSVVFEDAGISGATIAKRPGLRDLISFCRQHKRRGDHMGYVLVLNDSRFGRFDDPDEAAHLRFELKRHGWIVRFAEADEVEDPGLRHILRAVAGAQASEYRRNLRENSKRGKHGTVRQGYWVSREPFGYRRAVVWPERQARVLEKGVPKATGEKVKLVPGPAEEVAAVQEVFRRYASGEWSMRRCAKYLNAQPCARLGRAGWQTVQVHHLLTNEAYLGHIPVGRRTAERMARGDYSRTAPLYIVEHAHAPLIDADTFAAAAAQIARIPARSGVFDYRLRGLIVCETCGTPFVGGGSASRGPDKQRAKFYICRAGQGNGAVSGGACPPTAPTITAPLLEAAFIEGLANHIRQETSEEQVRAAFAARLTRQAPVPTARNVQRERAALTARRTRVLDAIEAGVVAPDDAKERLDAIAAELTALDTAVAQRPVQRDGADRLERLVARARDLALLLDQTVGFELRQLAEPWLAQATFNKNNRVLTMHFRTLETLATQDLPG